MLRPEAVGFAPALGLLLFNASPLVGNLRWLGAATGGASGRPPGLTRACALAQELFFHRERTQPLTATRSQSHPAYYLTPQLLAHVIGLSLPVPRRPEAAADAGSMGVPRDDGELDAQLRALGVGTNKFQGEPTGVSLARWKKLVRLVTPAMGGGGLRGGGGGGGSNTDAAAGEESVLDIAALVAEGGVAGQLGTGLLLRLLWEKAESKACLLRFLVTLDEYTPVGSQPLPSNALFLSTRVPLWLGYAYTSR